MSTKQKGIIFIIFSMLQRNKNFFLYALIGVSGATLDFITFLLLANHFAMPYQFANVISVSLGITNNFTLNTLFNFRVRTNLLKRFFQFYSVGLIGMGISAFILYILVERLNFGLIVAKPCIILIVTLIQYNLNKKITFK